jgi:glycosyltransferase involved in cell wall biosynthesis
MTDPYLLWVGPIVDPAAVLRRRAVSPAGNGWQLALFRSLSEQVPVALLGHTPEPLWPRGTLRVDSGPEVSGVPVNYLNFPGIRSSSLRGGYRAGLRRLIATRGKPAAVLAYNDSPWNVAVGALAKDQGIPWICIVADAPGAGRELAAHQRRIAAASGCVFLSWGRYRDWDGAVKLHLDGGIASLGFDPRRPPAEARSPRVVLYAGAMSAVGGALHAVEAFRHVTADDVELWICGHGGHGAIQQGVARDPRVRLLGMLDDVQLQQVLGRADVFINPRPPDLAENRSNFPSKVLEYLRWGQPVVSTWTDGLAPEYAEVLTLVDGVAPKVLAAGMEQALAFSTERRAELAARVAEFVTRHRLWSLQAERLVTWLQVDVRISGLGGTRSRPPRAGASCACHAREHHA